MSYKQNNNNVVSFTIITNKNEQQLKRKQYKHHSSLTYSVNSCWMETCWPDDVPEVLT